MTTDSDRTGYFPADALLPKITRQFTDFILSREHPCLGAKSALRNDAYQVSHYDTLGTPASANRLATDLLSFIKQRDVMVGNFTTFVAIFDQPDDLSEEEFEAQLWQQLIALHAVDRHPWASSVASEPADPNFGFSFGGVAFFVVGLHARSNRLARRFQYPTLVFNAHAQFEQLRKKDKFKKMQHVIRERDRAWQGSDNPMLTDFGTTSEARQYSGRAVGADWQCPFLHQDASR